MTRFTHLTLRGALAALALLSFPRAAHAQLKINEIFYSALPPGGNQYVELKNTASTNAYLDGLILTDEGSFGTEGVFKFPGSPGGTNFPVAPGARIMIAVDASGATSAANWECYAGGTDTDNPAVSNLTLVSGSDDLSFAAGGDNCLLANGTDTVAPIDPATVIDGVNYGGGGGELAPLGPNVPDQAPWVVAVPGESLGRCLDGVDTDYGSAGDFISAAGTPKSANSCTFPHISVADAIASEGNSGTNYIQFVVSLNTASTNTVAVSFLTSNGTAVATQDYIAVAGSNLVFAPGTLSVTTQVGVIGDTIEEPSETFIVHLYLPSNAIVVDADAMGVILDEEGSGLFTSVFTRIRGGAGAITAEWNSVSGHTYMIQHAAQLIQPAWSNLDSFVMATGVLASIVDTNTAAATQRVFRVLQLD